jgi:hypothetical protein
VLCAIAVIVAGIVVGITAPRGAARASTPGDGCLVVSSGFGNVSLSLSRGVIFGRVQTIGAITVDDTNPADNSTAQVLGAGSSKALPDGRIRYTGNQTGTPIRFRSTGGVKIKITDATQLDLSVVGKGVAVLSSGTFDVPGQNTYSVDAASFCQDNFQPVPPPTTNAPGKPVKLSISSPTS